jgi:hypothetical protein
MLFIKWAAVLELVTHESEYFVPILGTAVLD